MKKILLVLTLLLSVFLFVGCSEATDQVRSRSLGLLEEVTGDSTNQTNLGAKSDAYFEVVISDLYGCDYCEDDLDEEADVVELEQISKIFSTSGSLYKIEVLKINSEDGNIVKYIYKMDETNFLEVMYVDAEELLLLVKLTINGVATYQTKYDLEEVENVYLTQTVAINDSSLSFEISFEDEELYIVCLAEILKITESVELGIIFDSWDDDDCDFDEDWDFEEDEDWDFEEDEDWGFEEDEDWGFEEGWDDEVIWDEDEVFAQGFFRIK